MQGRAWSLSLSIVYMYLSIFPFVVSHRMHVLVNFSERNQMFLIASTNVGSLGRGEGEWDPNEVSEVRRNLYNVNERIKQEYDKYPDVLCIQEAGNFEVEIGPQFTGGPLATDAHVVQISNYRDIARGVATYAKDPDTGVAAPVDTKNELVTTIHKISYSNGRGNKEHKVAVLNVYRNAHREAVGTSVKDLRKCIAKQVHALEGQGIRKVLICGDFNSENLTISGFSELNHVGMYHRHKDGGAKKYIDKVFANFAEAQVIEAYPTCENRDQNEAGDLGHKVLLIGVGKRRKPNKPRTAVNQKKFRKLARNIKLDDKIKSLEIDDLCSPELVGAIADFITEKTTEIKTQAESVIRKGTMSVENRTLQSLENRGEDIMRNQKASGVFNRFVEVFLNGVEWDEGKVDPELEEFRRKAVDKLENLNPGDREFSKGAIQEIFGRDEEDKKMLNFPGKKQWKKLVLSASNSGAKDVYGLSLRLTKILIRQSKDMRNLLYKLMAAMAKIGVVPREWKVDLISFLYKKKGERANAKNWRPITSAASFGKHFDRVVLWGLRKMSDENGDNHAYIVDRSCLTAVLAVMEFLKKVRKMQAELGKEFILIPVVMAEDISSAFESIDHVLIGHALDCVYNLEGNFRIKDTILSYLDRESWIMDRKQAIKLNLRRSSRTKPPRRAHP